VHDPAIGVPAPPSSYSPPTVRAATILVAEDNPSVRTLTRSILELEGYHVIEASDGATALALAQCSPVDLLVTDVIMPGMNGKELAARIEQLRSKVPVLYVSGYTEETIDRHAVLGPDDLYLPKPFSPDQLIEKVRQAFAEGARRSIG
jgi:two-component system cell cycle sensor histidine kinase/response regulator CckA